MSGKGSGRRPQQAPEQDVKDAWDRIFKKKKEETPSVPKPK